jgi:hypothetical protein
MKITVTKPFVWWEKGITPLSYGVGEADVSADCARYAREAGFAEGGEKNDAGVQPEPQPAVVGEAAGQENGQSLPPGDAGEKSASGKGKKKK